MSKISDKEHVHTENQLRFEYQPETRSRNFSQKTSLIVKEIGSDDIYNKWLKYVQNHDMAHPFCHPLWIKTLEYENNCKATVFVCFDENLNIKGVLPLIPTLGLPLKLQEAVTSKRLSSLPRTPQGSFLFDNDEAREVLIKTAMNKVTNIGKFHLQLKSYSSELSNDIDDIQKISWRDSYYLDLPESPDKIRFGNSKQHHNVKWGVNKAKNLGIVLRYAETEEDLKKWYKLYLETMRFHVVASRSYKFFKYIMERLVPSGLAKILLAEQHIGSETTLLAGSMFLMFNKTVFYSFNGRSTSGLACHANDLIQWEAIHAACADRYKIYDMGEVCENNTGLAQFKSKWGCKTRSVYHFYYPHDEKFKLDDLDYSDNLKLRKVIWRKLPLEFTKQWGILTNKFL